MTGMANWNRQKTVFKSNSVVEDVFMRISEVFFVVGKPSPISNSIKLHFWSKKESGPKLTIYTVLIPKKLDHSLFPGFLFRSNSKYILHL